MTSRQRWLPSAAVLTCPNRQQLEEAWEWWRTADQEDRDWYVGTRKRLLAERGGKEHGLTLRSFGSTGVQKQYLWGPCTAAVDSFFHRTVFAGSKNGKAAKLSIGMLLASRGGQNRIAVSRQAEGSPTSISVNVSIENNDHFREFKDAIAGHDLLAAPSVYDALDRLVGMRDYVSPGAIVAFTGEPVPPGLLEKMKSEGIEGRDQMRCWDGGATFYTCERGNRHWIDMLATARPDEDGRLISTDLFNLSQPHVDYWNGDVVSSYREWPCECGRQAVGFEFQNRAAVSRLFGKTGFSMSYVTMWRTVESMAAAAGLGKVLAAVFGVSPSVGMVEAMQIKLAFDPVPDDRQVRDLELKCLGQFGRVLGVERVEVVPGVSWEERKLRRIYVF